MGQAAFDDEFFKEIIDEYTSECLEQIDDAEPFLASAQEVNIELANKLFRPLHSIKGASASLGFEKITEVVHEAETLLSCFRNGENSTKDRQYLAYFLSIFDYIRKMLKYIKENHNDHYEIEESKQLAGKAKKLLEQMCVGNETCLLRDDKEKCSGSIKDSKEKTADIIPIKKEVSEPQQPVKSEPKVVAPSAPQVSSSSSKTTETSEEEEDEGFLVMGQDMLLSFKTESVEAMDIIEESLLNLEKYPNEDEIVHKAYRAMHSFKGNCGIFALKDLEKFGHRIETLFDQMRQKVLVPSASDIATLVEFVDVIRNRVSVLELNDHGKLDQLSVYLDILETIISRGGKKEESKLPESKKDSVEDLDFTLPSASEDLPPSVQTEAKVEAELPKPQVEAPPIKTEEKEAILPAPVPPSSTATGDLLKQNIRVDVGKLDVLNNLVGELVTARTMLAQTFSEMGVKDERIDREIRFLGRISTDLHDITLSIRMVPIVGLFKKLIRTVHDISHKSGKAVDFKYFGEDTEVDKTLLEKLSDPLVHMIRNAVDHGIEPPSERKTLGKPEKGGVTLWAKHEAGEVWIVLKDDGRGLDREKIFNKALSTGLVTDRDKMMSDSEVYQLIFKPGFSTAAVITDISGRGVGMDVVLQNLKSLKGRVDIQTHLGTGTTFTLKIPLTLAIIKGMLLRVGDVKFSIPIENILESVKIESPQITTLMNGQQLVKIRNHMIPVVNLGAFYQLDSSCKKIEDGILVIVEGKGHHAGLLVDSLMGQHEAVVRPIPRYFKELVGISGCTILGNGDIGLILDTGFLDELVQRKVSP